MATIKIIALGLVAFVFNLAGEIMFGQVMKVVSSGRSGPIIGAAGVSFKIPMAAGSLPEGRFQNSGSYILMYAIGPNVAGIIGTAQLLLRSYAYPSYSVG